jgi:poly(3-hydroxybutyrate) depolymerase
MRNVLFCFVLLGIGYLYFEKSGVSVSEDDQFRMPALEAPEHVGRLIEVRRGDLFVPHSGKFEYSVPEHTAREATIHWIGERRWYSYHPDAKHGPSPVIMLLHGAGRNGLSMIDMWRETADQHGLFLIALDGKDQNWPTEAIFPTILHDILSQAGEVSPIDQEHIFLFGHSNGARYVQNLLNRANGPWRAAAVHAGIGGAGSAIVPEHPKPLRLYLGTRDHIFHTDPARSVAHALAANGHPVELHLIPNHTHWFYDAGPKIAEDAWTWFARQ